MTNNPELSIVIPVYNGGGEISTCLDSIVAAARPNMEIVVVDDGSTDNTPDLLQKYPCRVITLPKNSGRGAARNRGIEVSRAPIILFTDADCIVDKNWAVTALHCFKDLQKQDPLIVAVEGRILPMKGFINKCDAYAAYGYNQDLTPRYTHHFCTANVIVDKQKIIETGLFNEKIPNQEDRDLGFRLIDRGGKLYYQPAFAVTHNHARRNWREFLRHEYEWGRTIGNYFDVRYPQYHASPLRSWMRSPFLYAITAPLFAVLIPLKIIVHNIRHDWSVAFLYPLLLTSKALYRIGALEFLRKNRWTEYI